MQLYPTPIPSPPTIDIAVDPDQPLDLTKGYVNRYWCARLQTTPALLLKVAEQIGSSPRGLIEHFQKQKCPPGPTQTKATTRGTGVIALGSPEAAADRVLVDPDS